MLLNDTLRRLARAALIVPFVVALPAAGQVLNLDLNLFASDGTPFNSFGDSVAISGTTAIIGATNANSVVADSSGAAYLFDTTTGQPLFKLTASDAEAYDSFGSSVSISGTTAIVGAYFNSNDGTGSGSAYLYDTTTGQELFKLTASDAGASDTFGISVAVSGTTAVIGSHVNDDTGAAYLFDTSTGQQLLKLSPSKIEPWPYISFGRSVAISGTTAIIGAYSSAGAGNNSGSAYLFDTETGQQLFKLTLPDAAPNDQFGWSVAISGTIAIIGANGKSGDVDFSGAAYLYDTTTGQQISRLTASDAAPYDKFGWSVAISGSTVIVGARDEDLKGSAYVFDVSNPEVPVQTAKLTSPERDTNDYFGVSVAISELTAIVGSPRTYTVNYPPGEAYVYTPVPAIVAQPQSTTVTVGETATFNVGILGGDINTSYRWRRDGIDLADIGNISGANTSTLSIVATENDVGFYSCVLTSDLTGEATTSEEVVLGVRPDPNACYPDANGDGVLDFFDISQFIIEFGRGCP